MCVSNAQDESLTRGKVVQDILWIDKDIAVQQNTTLMIDHPNSAISASSLDHPAHSSETTPWKIP